jgi:hypothetical protein
VLPIDEGEAATVRQIFALLDRAYQPSRRRGGLAQATCAPSPLAQTNPPA